MKYDIKSNFLILTAIAFGIKAAAAQNSLAVDLSDGASAAFFCVMEADGTNGTAVCKLQHSADGTTDWTDEVTGALNDTTASLTNDAETCQLDVVNPRRRFYRVVMTPDTADTVLGAISVLGPLNHVAPA